MISVSSRCGLFTVIEEDNLYYAARSVLEQYEHELPLPGQSRARQLVDKILTGYNNRLEKLGQPKRKSDESLVQKLRSGGLSVLQGVNNSDPMRFGCPKRLINYQVRTQKYRHFQNWLNGEGSQSQVRKQIQDIFDCVSSTHSTGSVAEIIKIVRDKIATLPYSQLEIVYESELTVIFLGLDNGFLAVNDGVLYVSNVVGGAIPKTSFEQILLDKQVDTKPLNDLRAIIADFYRIDPSRKKALFLACSVGTGVGKSYGAMQSYVNYIETQFSSGFKPNDVGCGGFMNYVFMTPQKAQININRGQLDKLEGKGVQLLSVLGRNDQSNPYFADWLTGEKNIDVYSRCFAALGYESKNCKVLLRGLVERIKQEEATKKNNPDDKDTLRMLEQEIYLYRNKFLNNLQALCLSFLDDCERSEQLIDLMKRGVAAEKGLRSSPQGVAKKVHREAAIFTLLKKMFPFEICKHMPSVLAMTSAKALMSAYHLKKKKKDDGYSIEFSSLDRLIGSKCDKYISIGEQLRKDKTSKQNFIKDEYFCIDKDNPYLLRNVNFTIVIDELHVTYNRFQNKTIVELLDHNIHLVHVLSTAGRFIDRAEKIKQAGFIKEIPDDSDPNWELKKELVVFYGNLNKTINEKCSFINGVTGLELLKDFIDDLSNFEVDGRDAASITHITKNVFSFNIKMYSNLVELRTIRIKKDIYTGAKQLYLYQADSVDNNPTLHDLYQLIIVLIGVGTQIKSAAFLSWIKTSNHSQEGHHHVFYRFINRLHSISKEVKHILDLPSHGDLDVDFLYAYFQPKIVFSMRPIKKISEALFDGKKETIYLSFSMSMIKAAPEVSFLNMLVGTKNRVLPLSATSGYYRLYDSNYSSIFMKDMCKLLNVDFIHRDEKNLEDVEALRDLKANCRSVKFNIINEGAVSFVSYSPDAIKKSALFEKKIWHALLQNPSKKASVGNPFKQKEIRRQISALIDCYEHRQNGLSLAISHDFQNSLRSAIYNDPQYFKINLGIEPVYTDSGGHPRILAMDLYDQGHRLIIVLFDSALLNALDEDKDKRLEDFITITDSKTNIMLISSFGAAGTGLNNVVIYQYKNIVLEEDYQNIYICGSSFFSPVKGKEEGLDTLYNHAIYLKYLADQRRKIVKMSELPRDLYEEEPAGVLMNEHRWGVVKSKIQGFGRGERRDTKLETVMHMPEDVMADSAFVFKALVKNTKRNRDFLVYKGMSLLGKTFADKSVSYMQQRSFSEISVRHDFETVTKEDGLIISQSHMTVLRRIIRQYKNHGDIKSLNVNEVYRSADSFIDPKKWLRNLSEVCEAAKEDNLLATVEKMFVNTRSLPKNFMLCKKTSALDDYTLTDYIAGSHRYQPWEMIFPKYSSDLSNASDYVTQLQKRLDGYKSKIVANHYVPSPAIIPLLRGNVGEYIVLDVIRQLGFSPLTIEEVRSFLGSEVYEVFDFYFIVRGQLICVDAKFWSTKRDNPELVNKVRGCRHYKPEIIMDAVKASQQDQPIKKIVYLYANAFYGDTCYTDDYSETNKDGSIKYLNVFIKDFFYEETVTETTNKVTGKVTKRKEQVMREKVCINPSLMMLFSAEIT